MELGALARRQGGVFTRRQAHCCGISNYAVDAVLRSGRWCPVYPDHRGVLADATLPRKDGWMRALVQVVTSAAVTVADETVGRIDEPGLVVLVGVTHDDTPDYAQRLANKVWNLRVMDDEKSASDVGAPLLVVSQFTLYAELNKGRRPSWSAAAPGPVSEPLVAAFCDALREAGARVETGRFGADMKVALVNDGPRTVLIEV